MNIAKTLTLTLSTLAVACAPGAAGAATRYAAPEGAGPVSGCPADDPCSLAGALDYARVRDGDEIVLGPGTYEEPSGFGTDKAISVHGLPGASRPVVRVAAGTAFYLDDPQLTISDVAIDDRSSGIALFLRAGTAERVDARSQSGSGCFGGAGTIRDTVCASGEQPGLTSGWSNPITYTLRLRNVTAVSTGSYGGSSGISVSTDQGGQATVDAKSVIAHATSPNAPDVYASGGGVNSPGGYGRISLEASNYDSALATATGTITPPGSGDNQTDAPLFVDLDAGDLRPATGSPTIDAGVVDEHSGSTDALGGPREVGGGVDIGAYEFVPAAPSRPDPDPVPSEPSEPSAPTDPGPSAPDTRIARAPRPRVHRRRARFGFVASVGDARFECSLDRSAYRSCSSPLRLRVRRGRHLLVVRAVDSGGAVDPSPARASWRVLPRRPR